MLRSFIYSALFATSALGYRVSEYTGERCTGSEVGFHQLAGPSGCDSLRSGVASSVFVKVDNVHDDQYAINVYDKGDSSGSSGTLAKNLINSAKSEGLTNAVWQVHNDDGRIWEVSLQLHDDSKQNTDNCGACPTCL